MNDPLLLTCPDCGLVLDATNASRGSEMICTACSKRLPVPIGIFPPPPTFASRAASIFGACALLGCVSFATLMASPNFAAENRRMHRGAARRWVRAICWGEVLQHAQGRPWVALAPVPATVPAKTIPFMPPPALAALDFRAKQTAFQFSIRVDGTAGVICEARNAAMTEVLAAKADATGVESEE